jgi:hypothetical protein
MNMADTDRQSKKHEITWQEFESFARDSGRDLTHVFRVFRGERLSEPLHAEFRERFGFDMRDAVLAGRRRHRRVA